MAKTREELKDRPLHDVVEGLFREQKHDIYLYTRGHLNHDHLWKPPEAHSRTRWEGSAKNVPPKLKTNRIPTPARGAEGEQGLVDAMCSFSMGASGSSYIQPKPKHACHPQRTVFHQSPVGGSHGRGPGSEVNPQRPNTQEGYVADSVYVEELRLPELMLPKVSKKSPRRRSRDESKDSGAGGTVVAETHRFIPSHLAGITKKDQYGQFKHFQEEILRTSDTLEKSVLTGRKAVEHLEQKLVGELMMLDAKRRQCGPNFHRLQIHSNIWQELIEDTPIFRGILSQIKTQYDQYLGSLLDTQPHRHSELLAQQVQGLKDRCPVLPGETTLGQDHVQKLEEEAMCYLGENERLRKSLREEEARDAWQPEAAGATQSVRPLARNQQTPLSLSEQVIKLHADILTKIDEIGTIRQDLRANYVPSSVCHHLEQNIRDTEADILKLLSTNEYLGKTIQQIENEVDTMVEKNDVPEADIRLIWKRINALPSGLAEGQ